MLVRSIELSGVTAYPGTARLELPEQGVVLVSGPNGAGKSTWVEAVAAACWSETLRGTPVWRADEVGQIRLETYGGLSVVRSCTKSGTKKLDWWTGDGKGRKRFESPTKAAEELHQAIGTFEAWRRTSVFSSSDADTFADSANTARVQLLERLFGLDKFGPAQRRARDERATVDRARAVVEGRLRELRAGLEADRRSLEEARRLLTEAPEHERPEPDEYLSSEVTASTADDLRQRAEKLRREVLAYKERIAAAEERANRAKQEAALAVHRAASVADKDHALQGGSCPTCGTKDCPKCGHPIITTLRGELAETIRVQTEEADRVREAAAAQAEAAAAEADELREERDGLRSQADRVEERARGEDQRVREARRAAQQAARARAEVAAAREARAQARARASEMVGRLEEKIAHTERMIEESETARRQHADRVAVLDGVDRALGVQGVRTQVLSRGLVGLSTVAGRLFDLAGWEKIGLELRPFRELADGTRKDELDLVISGAGGGYGYRGSSGGERRRVDVGLVLALAEVGAAAHGRRGTLWFDEVFDALDAGGLDGIARILETLGADRPIVVITHRADLADRLQPAAHWRAGGQKLQRAA